MYNLSEAEKAAGYVRPLRYTYMHEVCENLAFLSPEQAQLFARNPKFLGSLYCRKCERSCSVDEFVWCNGVKTRMGT